MSWPTADNAPPSSCDDRPAALLATLLVGNNVSNYLGTAGLAVILEAMQLSDWQSILLNTLIVTPLLFVFGETLPKDTMASHSDRLMPPLTPLLTWSNRLFTWCGVVPLIQLFSGGVLRLLGQDSRDAAFPPRRRVEMLVREGVGHGLLSDEQSAIADRVLRLGNRTVSQEMVPWAEVIKLSSGDTSDRIWDLADRSSRSRFPVIDAKGKLLGAVDVFEALLHRRESCPPLPQLTRRCITVAADTPLRTALQWLQKDGQSLAVVEDHGRPVGLITIKDLVEPITGELTSW